MYVFIGQRRLFDFLPARIRRHGDVTAQLALDLYHQGDFVSLRRLQKPLEFLIAQPRVTDNIPHGDCIDGVMARNRDDSGAAGLARYNFSSRIDMTARMFGVVRRNSADCDLKKNSRVVFRHPWHLGPANPWRDDGSGKFPRNRLKQPLPSSRQGLPGPSCQGRQLNLVAAPPRYVIPLTSHPETRLVQGSYRVEVIDPGQFRQNFVPPQKNLWVGI